MFEIISGTEQTIADYLNGAVILGPLNSAGVPVGGLELEFSTPEVTVTFPGAGGENISVADIVAALISQLQGAHVEVRRGVQGHMNPAVGQELWVSLWLEEAFTIDSESSANAALGLSTTEDTASGGPLEPGRVRSLSTGLAPGQYALLTSAESTGDGGEGGVTDHGALTGLEDDDHTQYQLRSEKGSANGYAGLDGSGLLSGSVIPYGSTAGTVCEGDDARLSDARTPTAHSHAIEDVTGLGDALTGKADAAHSHDEASESAAGFMSVQHYVALEAVRKGFASVRTVTESDDAEATDLGGLIVVNDSDPNTQTIPHGIGAPGQVLTWVTRDVGQVTIAEGANVSILVPPGATLVAQEPGATECVWLQAVKLVSGTTDVWALTGHLEPA